VSTAKLLVVNVSQLLNIIKNKVTISLYWQEKKTLKDTRDSESISRINCRKRAAVVVDQVCAVGWLLFRR